MSCRQPYHNAIEFDDESESIHVDMWELATVLADLLFWIEEIAPSGDDTVVALYQVSQDARS